MTVEVTAFRAADGTLFSTQEQCDAYEVQLAYGAAIKSFVSQSTYAGLSENERSRIAMALAMWEAKKLSDPALSTAVDAAAAAVGAGTALKIG